MNILISTPYYLPNVSGITMYIKIIAEELVNRGYKVTILTSKHLSKLPNYEIVNGVVIKRMWAPIKIGKGVVMPFFPLFSLLQILRADVINCHLPQIESSWMVLWSKIFGKKVILTHHTDLSFWNGWMNKLIDGVVFISQYIACLLADVICPYTIDYSKNSYLLRHFEKKIIGIYPPIKLLVKKSVTRLFSLKPKCYLIGFCGRVARQKGFDVLIKSVVILDKILDKNYKIVVAGPIEIIGEYYYDYLLKTYSDILREKFVFLGPIERDRLVSFYRSVDVLVLPSNDRLESFGWVQIEAMMCGTPCVATNLPGMREPIERTGMGVLFELNNELELADSLVFVLKKGKRYYNRYSKNLSFFDYNKSIQQYEKVFSKN